MFDRIVRIRSSRLPLRTIDIGGQLDTFLLFAIGTILLIRTQLWLTNYPQLGGGGLHIAHLLWGGLGMMIAVVTMAIFISPAARRFGAVMGGIGFGFFIDELGKFVTSDNNYFFRPTAAMIYIIFILIYFVTRKVRSQHGFTSREYLVNSIELLKETALHDMDERDKQRALEMLEQADQKDPLVEPLRELIRSSPTVEPDRPMITTRVAHWFRDRYFDVIRASWFGWLLVCVFGLWALASIGIVIALVISIGIDLSTGGVSDVIADLDDQTGDLTVFALGRIVSAGVSGVLMLIGISRLRHSRLAAYRMFNRALLVALLITQFCAFVETQFGAVIGFLINITLWLTLRYMIHGELELERREHEGIEVPAKGTRPAPDVAPAPG